MMIWEEGDMWVAYLPQLDLSSGGNTREEAIKNIKEAAGLWFESCVERGAIIEALEELNWFLEFTPNNSPKVVKGEKLCLKAK
jgi:predicted RNase H-like HicB family nuclease